MTIDEMIASVPVGTTKMFTPKTTSAGEQSVRFMEVRFNHDHQADRFLWLNPPDVASIPMNRTPNTPGRSLEQSPRFKFDYDGDASELPDFYKSGPAHFASERLLEIMLAADPHGVEYRTVELTARREVVPYYIFLPLRSFWAVDPEVTVVAIAKRPGSRKPLVKITYPDKFRMSASIPDDVHVFADIARPKLYWSRTLVEACKARGIKGISARAGYVAKPFSVEI